jgi:glycosyltransferase involved in cell wall biosynthesis
VSRRLGSAARSYDAFRAGQLGASVIEHLTVRRGRENLGDTLRAYGGRLAGRASQIGLGFGELHSIVVPCFGHAEFLEDVVASIVAQDHRPLELVFVDDASPDGTRALLPRIVAGLGDGITAKVVELDANGGQCAAINRGVLASAGAAITIVNDDDYLLHDAVSLARAALTEHGAALFGAGGEFFWGQRPAARAAGALLDVVVRTPPDIFALPSTMNLTHTGSTFLRGAFDLVRGYRPLARTRVVVASDRDFHLRVASAFTVVTAASTVLAFLRQDSSMDSERFT